MRQKLLIGAAFCGSVIWGSGNVGAACTPTPSCTELGYTKTQSECGDSGIKCPFGNFWSCNVKPNRRCQIGWIYYEDGTCVTPVAHNTSKIPLGVVVYVNPNGIGGQVMSAWPIDANGNMSNSHNSNVYIKWGGYGTNTSAPDYTSQSSAATNFSSCSNTDKLIADGGASTYPAAWAARLYAPTTETKGKWCLPAAGVLTSIYNNQSAVQAGISKLGGLTYPDCCTWSSSEEDYHDAWHSSFSGSYGLGDRAKKFDSIVRPVLEF